MMTASTSSTTTVALVHGAFADSGSWNGVTELLLAAGVPVQAVSNPLRGIADDAAYVASAIRQIPGPVLAVGHSYGGAVITNAALDAGNVVGLVYVAAFAPEENETLGEIEGTSRDSVLSSALKQAEFPGGVELYVDPAQFHQAFAADLTETLSGVLGASQRPIAASAFDEKTVSAAWKKLPSWAVVATGDKAAGADVVRSMAERAGAEITEVEGSHVVMISKPREVTDVILAALASAGQK
jgi:pimeloyl-ACP methyl ester carboxylesterase